MFFGRRIAPPCFFDVIVVERASMRSAYSYPSRDVAELDVSAQTSLHCIKRAQGKHVSQDSCLAGLPPESRRTTTLCRRAAVRSHRGHAVRGSTRAAARADERSGAARATRAQSRLGDAVTLRALPERCRPFESGMEAQRALRRAASICERAREWYDERECRRL